MIKKKLAQLKENDIVALEVETPSHKMLLAPGTKLTKEMIVKLERMHIDTVTVRDDIELKPESHQVKEDTTQRVQDHVRKILERHTYRNKKELEELSQTADEIIEQIINEEKVVEHVYEIRMKTPDIYEHSVNVSSMSILMAIHLGLSKKTIHDIGVAGLLHDLGLRYITVDYINHNLSEMSEKDRKEFLTHPVYAYNVIQNETWLSDATKKMILNHHENMNGSGFPFGRQTRTTAEKILSIVEEFDDNVCGIANHPVKVFEAAEYLKIYQNIKYDRAVLLEFLNLFTTFPIGTKVRLNDGRLAMIEEQNQNMPDKPRVKLLASASGSPINNMYVDLSKEKTLYIESVEDRLS
ncbi:MAG: HD domain-containing protein [Lachnospiraceae bacterium]|nr:HD domain-containing protein [Lachnospiraceae bacterium]